MRFSLKSLLLATAVVPPIAWLAYLSLRTPMESDEPLRLPDPIGTIGVIAWIAIYYNLVHKRL